MDIKIKVRSIGKKCIGYDYIIYYRKIVRVFACYGMYMYKKVIS